MSRISMMGFAILAYLIFFATFLYLIAFVGDLPFAPVTVDRGGTVGSPTTAAAVDLSLIALFGLQHSGMARRGFKRWWTRFVSETIERSLYVLASSGVLILLFALWRPIEAPLWSVGGIPALLIQLLFATGWTVVLLSTFLINHFELFGLQQAWLRLRGGAAADPVFRTPFLYRLVRHPLYLGFLIAFWAAPTMTAGRFLFATAMTLWMLLAIQLEERDLTQLFGDHYRSYRERVGMLVPNLLRR